MSGGNGPSIPVAIASILLIAGLAATAIVMAENPVPISTLVATPGASSDDAATPLRSAKVAGVSVTPSPPATATPVSSVAPTAEPTAEPTVAPTSEPSPAPTVAPTPEPTVAPTPRPTASPAPTATPRPSRQPKRTATPTRIEIAGLGIDIPVIAPADGRARCGVAQWLEPLKHPATGETVYLYGNAVAGTFRPIYTAVKRDQAALIGELITVWTGDDFAWTYRVTGVRRHQTEIDWAFSQPENRLIVQTADDGGAMMLIAKLVAVTPSKGDEAHPNARPRACP